MTDDTTPTPTPTEPAPAATQAEAAPAAATPVSAARPQTKRRGAGWWVLVSVAGVGLLIVGLLGGILIGQHTRGSGIGDRAGFTQSDGRSSDRGGQTRGQDSQGGRLRDGMRDRQQGPQGSNGVLRAPDQSGTGQGQPTVPTPGTGG